MLCRLFNSVLFLTVQGPRDVLVSGLPINQQRYRGHCSSIRWRRRGCVLWAGCRHDRPNIKTQEVRNAGSTWETNSHNSGSATTNHRRGVDGNCTTEAGSGGGSSGGGGVAEAMPFQRRPVLFTKEDFSRTQPGTVGHDILSYFFVVEEESSTR